MELQDYVAALRRHWGTACGVAMAALLAALVVVLVSPRTYQATAQVFVSSADDSTSGSQFVNQRVTSYPEVAGSSTVLDPVIDDLGLTTSGSDLRKQVSATNPIDTSQIQIAVEDEDPVLAARIANSVAEHFGAAVEALEQTGQDTSPVSLTVTNPATVPTAPVSPQPGLILPLGLVVGLALGAAAAVVRNRVTTRLHSAADVRSALGDRGSELRVHEPAGRRRGTVRRPATHLARQLEPLAESGPVGVVVLSATLREQPAAQTLVARTAAELAAWDVPVDVVEDLGTREGRGVWLSVGSPTAPLRYWRQLAQQSVRAVVVVEPGRTDAMDLQELGSVLATAGMPVLAVVLSDRRDARPVAPAEDATRLPDRGPSGRPAPVRIPQPAVGTRR